MSEDTLNHCANQGILVDGESWVPIDPTDFSPWRVMGFLLGCSNLLCADCGAVVRNKRGLATKKRSAKRAEQLYETEDWTTLKWVRSSKLFRTYACRCTIHVTGRSKYLSEPDPDLLDEPMPAWSCQGHPSATMPFAVDGRRFNSDTDFDDLVADVLAGWAPKSPVPGGYEQWISRLYERLRNHPAQEILAHALARALRTQDEAGIGTLLIFFARHPRSITFNRMLDWLESRGPKAQSTYPDHSGSGARFAVATVLASRVEEALDPPDIVDTRSAELLQAMAVDDSTLVDEAAILHLVGFDPDWAAMHAADIAAAHPSIWVHMLHSLHRHDDSLVVIAGTAIAGVDPVGLNAWLNTQPTTPWSMVLRQALP